MLQGVSSGFIADNTFCNFSVNFSRAIRVIKATRGVAAETQHTNNSPMSVFGMITTIITPRAKITPIEILLIKLTKVKKVRSKPKASQCKQLMATNPIFVKRP